MKPDEIKLRNLMIECSESGNTQQFIELYKSNPEIHSAGSWLYNAAEDGQPELIRYLISVGRDPNERSRYSLMTSALSAASRNGSIQSVELLLRAGASLGVDSIDDNPLFSAIYGRNLDCAKLLVKAGIDFHKTYGGLTWEYRIRDNIWASFSALEYGKHIRLRALLKLQPNFLVQQILKEVH